MTLHSVAAGGLTVIIEARVDLRDSTGWDTLDRAITRLGGAAAGAAGAAADAGAAAAATAAAAAAAASAVSPADSDEEDTAGGSAPLFLRFPIHVCVRVGCLIPAFPF
jgi:hypothetical protein